LIERTLVDFWDLTKLLARRWWIAVPMLGITAALSMLTVANVSPDYVATSYALLVPPAASATQPGQPSSEQRNPWLALGLQALGTAANLTVADQAVITQLKGAGYSDSYTVEMGQYSPTVTFVVTGSSERQAQETADQLVNRFITSVASLQSAYGVAKPDAISVRRLDVGNDVKESTSKVKRALVAVAAAGLLLTAGATVGIDAWLRRRARRQAGYDGMPMPPVPVQPRNGRLSLPEAAKVARQGSIADDAEFLRRRSPNAEIPHNNVHAAPVNASLDESAPAEAVTASVDVRPREREVVPEDVTIVLPLSTQSMDRNGRNADKGPRP
jgi:hypothetical protein